MIDSMQQTDWDQSAKAWEAFIERGDPNRVYLLDPVMLEAAGDVAGKTVLDVGCGEGRFARMLAERGAHVVGLDPTVSLLKSAHNRGDARYVCANGERLPLQADSIDLVVSYVALIDIPDFRAAISEMARVCAPGGKVLVANLNSFATTLPNPWLRKEAGEKLHFVVENYFPERGETVSWAGIEVINYHRPLAAYLQAFLDSGLQLRKFQEPRPSPDLVQQVPSMRDNDRIAFFYVAEWVKPG